MPGRPRDAVRTYTTYVAYLLVALWSTVECRAPFKQRIGTADLDLALE